VTFYAIYVRPWLIAGRHVLPHRSIYSTPRDAERAMNILGVRISVDRTPTGRVRWTRRAIALGAANVVVLGGGLAYASWTAAGSGSGAATAASATTATVTAVATTEGGLWPGNATAVPLHFTVDNPNPYAVTYKTFSNVVFGTITAGPLGGSCTSADFTLSATSGTLPSQIVVSANGTAQAGTTTNILKMNATAGDGCQGAVINVTLKVAGTQN
jgi:hypothetical protein